MWDILEYMCIVLLEEFVVLFVVFGCVVDIVIYEDGIGYNFYVYIFLIICVLMDDGFMLKIVVLD